MTMRGYFATTCLAVLCLLTITIEEGLAMEEQRFHAVTLLDLDNPLPAAWLQKAGIDYVYASIALPVDIDQDGCAVIPDDTLERWEHVFQLYQGAGIKVLMMGNFYAKPLEGTQALDFFGRRHEMACFRQQPFLDSMRETLAALARTFGKYDGFGGFAIEDGVHIRVDCCYCDTCRRLFREQYGIEPPPFRNHRGADRVADDDPVLLWEKFQRESFENYLRTQSTAIRSVSEDLLMVTIPADSYFYGRFLNYETTPETSKLGSGARIQRIARIQPRDWYIFQSFPLARLPEATETGLQPWAIGCHITAQSPKMLIQTEGPFVPLYGRTQYMSPAEIERMTRVTVTEGANGICYWTSAAPLPYYPAAFDGMAGPADDIASMERLLMSRRGLPASIGLLYSTTTEVFEQPWGLNTSERWQHLHAFESTAYSLLRSNIPFDTVMEDELTPERLGQLDALVLPAARFLTESAAGAIEEAVAHGGLRAVVCGPHLPLKGAVEAPCDPLIWHRWASEGYRQEEHLNEQWLEIKLHLLPLLRPVVHAPVQVFSERAISRVYRIPGGALLVMIANWDLHQPVEAAVEGHGTLTDALSGQSLGELDGSMILTVPAAGWRVLTVAK